ncbi:MAG: hypothetical protein DRI56_03245 [Chloroflexota bacterium]|nr:MAG: hypothetical protein DRI56_03245 [Chloroflexota bacterium]
MSAANIAAAVQNRFATQLLIELTNSSNSATTIDTDVLEAAASDAIGEFERVTGIAHDDNNASHVAILCRGTVYFLEFYKARDTSLIKWRSGDFYGALLGIRKAVYAEAASNSNLTVVRERSGTRPDMDSARLVFGKRRVSGIRDTIEN